MTQEFRDGREARLQRPRDIALRVEQKLPQGFEREEGARIAVTPIPLQQALMLRLSRPEKHLQVSLPVVIQAVEVDLFQADDQALEQGAEGAEIVVVNCRKPPFVPRNAGPQGASRMKTQPSLVELLDQGIEGPASL